MTISPKFLGIFGLRLDQLGYETSPDVRLNKTQLVANSAKGYFVQFIFPPVSSGGTLLLLLKKKAHYFIELQNT
jgi:hypothetical protein